MYNPEKNAEKPQHMKEAEEIAMQICERHGEERTNEMLWFMIECTVKRRQQKIDELEKESVYTKELIGKLQSSVRG